MKKKLLAVVLMVAMVISLAACGGNDKKPANQGGNTTQTQGNTSSTGSNSTANGATGTEVDTSIIPKETVTLTVFSQLANFSGEQPGWFAKILLDKFNVKMNIVPDADGRLATLMESGNLGDIVVFGSDGADYRNAVNAGLLYDWEEDDLLEEYGPVIAENFQKALEKNRGINSDGKIHGYGHSVAADATAHSASIYHPDIRYDLYKQLGSPKISTLEDYIDVMKKMKEICPTSDTGAETYAVSLWPDWDGDMVMYVKATASFYGWDEFGSGLYSIVDQKWESALEEGGVYERCLRFYNQLYREGLLDPDSMTQTYDDAATAYKSGGAFFSIFNYSGSAQYNTKNHLDEGKAMLTVCADDFINLSEGLSVYGGCRVWTIGAKTQYPELCMAILNWLSSPEGAMCFYNGPKGANWDYDENGAPYLTELGIACKLDTKTEMPAEYGGGTYGDGTIQINNATWALDAVNTDAKDGSTFNYETWSSQLLRERSDIEKQWSEDAGGYAYVGDYLDASGHISVKISTPYAQSDISDELRAISDQAKQTIVNQSWKAIYAVSDAQFDYILREMRNKCYSYGYDQVIAYWENEARIRAELENQAKK